MQMQRARRTRCGFKRKSLDRRIITFSVCILFQKEQINDLQGGASSV
jgi:hypothetical protein